MENVASGAEHAWPGARFLERGCAWWVGHGVLMLLGGLAFVIAFFFGISRTRYDPGNPVLLVAAGIVYIGAAVALTVAATFIGVGVSAPSQSSRAGSPEDSSVSAGGRLGGKTAAATLVWASGALSGLAVAVWGLGFVISLTLSWLLFIAAAWAAGGGALTAGLIAWRPPRPIIGEHDFAHTYAVLLAYGVVNLIGASMIIVGFAGNLFEAFVLVAVMGAVLLTVLAPILSIAAFRRLRRAVGRAGQAGHTG